MIECPNCNCQLQKDSVTESLDVVPIYKCNTCECVFNDENIVKKKYSKVNALRRFLKNV